MSETHVNGFRADYDDAYTAVVMAVGALKSAGDALVAKLESDNPERVAALQAEPEAPAAEPKTDTKAQPKA